MSKKFKTPFEEQIEKEIRELDKTAKMQRELDKYGKPTNFGGRVWTPSDLAKFFLDKKVLKKRKR